jgi:HlyD family secretion protein
MNRRLIAIAAGALVLIAIVWLAYAWFAARSRYDYSGTIETREIEIGSKIGGRVTEVSAEEGQSVKAGQSLVRFECNELKAERMQAAAAVVESQADLDRMVRGNRP